MLRWLVLVLVLLIPFTCWSKEEAEETDWSQYDSIDPLDPSAGDFMDADASAVTIAANKEYRDGNYEQAARLYLAALKFNPGDSGGIYNLACCYGLLGEAELAALYLGYAVTAGYTDLGHVEWDPDFDPVRGSQVFIDKVAELNEAAEMKEAELGLQLKIESRAFFNCRVQLPEGYDPAEPYPLLVGLHGYGHWPDGFIKLWGRFEDPQFIYASPQAPYPFAGGKDIGYSWNTWSEEQEHVWPAATAMSKAYVRDVVEQLRAQYYVSDVYLLGFSQGCFMAYQVGLSDSSLVDGIMCFGGWLEEELIPAQVMEDASTRVRVFIAHGNEDKVVEYGAGETALARLEELGYDVTFFTFDGAHQVPEDACLAAQEWMMKPPPPVIEKGEEYVKDAAEEEV